MPRKIILPGIILLVIVIAFTLAATPKTAGQNWGLVTMGAIAVIAIGLALIVLAVSTDVLRDAAPSDFGGITGADNKPLRRPFSLAQTQMAWWFYLVLASYVYLYVSTGTLPTLTDQALILMGIGTGTALGAAMVEQAKTDDKQQRFKELVAKLKAGTATAAETQECTSIAHDLASHDFVQDILTDVNGVSLHRFQSAAWTVVLGGMFVVHVVSKGAMPTFDANTLALLGISSGAYLGFKIPEVPA